MKINSVLFSLLMWFSFKAAALSYCNVPSDYPTYGYDYDEVVELFPDVAPYAIWECGLINNIEKLESGNTEELHYKNAVILLDKKDYGFISLYAVDGYSIFGMTDKYNKTHYVAMAGDVRKYRQLIHVAMLVAIVDFKDFTFRLGERLYLPVIKQVAYLPK